MSQEKLISIIIPLYLYVFPIICGFIAGIIVTIFNKNKSLKNYLKIMLDEKTFIFVIISSFLIFVLNIIYTDWISNTKTIFIFYFMIILLLYSSKFINKLYIKAKIRKTFLQYKDCEYINRALNIQIKKYKNENIYNNTEYFKKLSKYPSYEIKFLLEHLKSQSNNNNSTFMAILFLLIGSIIGNPFGNVLSEFSSNNTLFPIIIPIFIFIFVSTSLYNSIYFTMLLFDVGESENEKKINLLKIYLNSINK